MNPEFLEKYKYQKKLFYRRRIKQIILAWGETERKLADLDAQILIFKNEHVGDTPEIDDVAIINEVYKSFGRRIKWYLEGK